MDDSFDEITSSSGQDPERIVASSRDGLVGCGSELLCDGMVRETGSAMREAIDGRHTDTHA